MKKSAECRAGGECAAGWALQLIHAERSSNASCRRARGLRRFRRLGADPGTDVPTRPPGSRQRVSRSSGLWRSRKEGMCGSGTRSLVSLRINSLRCLLSDGLRSEGLGISSPLLECHQVRGCASYTGLDVPVNMQLKFLQYYENVEVPQFPFLDSVLQLPVVLQRRVRVVQTVEKVEIPPCSLSTLFACPLLCVDRCRRWSRQCRKS